MTTSLERLLEIARNDGEPPSAEERADYERFRQRAGFNASRRRLPRHPVVADCVSPPRREPIPSVPDHRAAARPFPVNRAWARPAVLAAGGLAACVLVALGWFLKSQVGRGEGRPDGPAVVNDSTPTPAGLVLTVSPEAVRSVEWAEVWEDHYDPALDAATNLKWLEKNAPDPIRNAIAGLRRGGRSDEAILDELRPRSASGERSISSEWSIGYADGQIRVAARPRTTP